MSRLELLQPNDPALNLEAIFVPAHTINTTRMQLLIADMLEVAGGKQGDIKRRTMVGLAATQLGIAKRIIIVDINGTGMGEEPDLRVYINPIITPLEGSKSVIGREGCFSTGNVCGIVNRADRIRVQALNPLGEAVDETHNDFTARIFQHEADHLDGVRFPDRITDDQRLHWVEPDQFGEYREHWRTWDKLCERATWEAIKTSNQ